MILKSSAVTKFINGVAVSTTDKAIVSEKEYTTNGEGFIVVDSVPESLIKLDARTTDDITIKAMTKVVVVGISGSTPIKIDRQYDEILMDPGVSITFSYNSGVWYIVSSDGLKG